MAKQKKLKLAGAEFRRVNQEASNGICSVYVTVYCDITTELAEEMGWEIYTNGHLIGGLIGQTNLEGEISVEEVAMSLNGQRGTALECVASKASGFQLTRKKSDDGDGIETRLRFELVSTGWELIVGYFGQWGQADGVLTLVRPPEQAKLPTQATLEEQAEETEEEEPEEAEEGAGESRPGVLASVTSMRKRGMRT